MLLSSLPPPPPPPLGPFATRMPPEESSIPMYLLNCIPIHLLHIFPHFVDHTKAAASKPTPIKAPRLALVDILDNWSWRATLASSLRSFLHIFFKTIFLSLSSCGSLWPDVRRVHKERSVCRYAVLKGRGAFSSLGSQFTSSERTVLVENDKSSIHTRSSLEMRVRPFILTPLAEICNKMRNGGKITIASLSCCFFRAILF